MSDPSAKQIAEAILEVAAAIAPHNNDRRRREKIAEALSTLIDVAIAKART
jgi:hypothetical protein